MREAEAEVGTSLKSLSTSHPPLILKLRKPSSVTGNVFFALTV